MNRFDWDTADSNSALPSLAVVGDVLATVVAGQLRLSSAPHTGALAGDGMVVPTIAVADVVTDPAPQAQTRSNTPSSQQRLITSSR